MTTIDLLKAEALDEMQRYLAFAPGWDGYDGVPFKAETVARARLVIERFCEQRARAGVTPAEITPGPIPDGRIDVEVSLNGRRMIFTVDRRE